MTHDAHMSEFEKELASLLNRYSKEGGSNTPDFILAHFLYMCLQAFNHGVFVRECWYGEHHFPGRVKLDERK